MSFINQISEENYYGSFEKGSDRNNLVVVPMPEERMSKQQVPFFKGISGDTAGSKGICMNLVTLQEGEAGIPHIHKGSESAIYVMKGELEILFGPYLSNRKVCKAGEFLYIGADVPHQMINFSKTVEMAAIVSTADANEQESIVLYDPETDTLRTNTIDQTIY